MDKTLFSMYAEGRHMEKIGRYIGDGLIKKKIYPFNHPQNARNSRNV